MNLADNSEEVVIINKGEDHQRFYVYLKDVKIGDKFSVYFEDCETDNPSGIFLCGLYRSGEGRVYETITKNKPITLIAKTDDVNEFILFAGPYGSPYEYSTTFKNVCLVKGELPMRWMPSVNDIINKATS